MYDLDTVTVESASILAKLWTDTFQQAYADVHTLENIQAYCDVNFTLEQAVVELSSDKVVCVLARRNDLPVGFYLLKYHECPVRLDGSSVELKKIYILASEYGLGLGKLLYQDAINSIRSSGHGWVWLSVSDINYRAQAFYKKLGFNAVGTGPIFKVGTDRLTSTVLTYAV